MNQDTWASSLMESRGNLRINLSLSDPALDIKKRPEKKANEGNYQREEQQQQMRCSWTQAAWASRTREGGPPAIDLNAQEYSEAVGETAGAKQLVKKTH